MLIADLIARIAARRLQETQAELDLVPTPVDSRRYVAVGPEPDRVLVLGNGPAIGFGVRSQQLALPGQLARALSGRTARGCAVDVVPRRGLTAAALVAGDPTWGTRLSQFDAVVLCLGTTDAASFTPLPRWRAQFGAVLDGLRTQVSAGTSIVAVGARPVQRTTTTAGALQRRIDRHAVAIDAVIAEEAARRTDVLVPEPFDDDRAGPRTPADYEELALRIVDVLAPAVEQRVLEPSSASARARRQAADPEILRQAAVDRFPLQDARRSSELRRLLLTAQRTFDTTAAAVTIVDGDRVRFVASVGLDGDSTDRATAPCSTTIRQDGAMVVPELPDDQVARLGFRFYAGFPLESPDGYRIGTLCLLDDAPRPDDGFDRSVFAELAHRVERTLWAEAADRAMRQPAR